MKKRCKKSRANGRELPFIGKSRIRQVGDICPSKMKAG